MDHILNFTSTFSTPSNHTLWPPPNLDPTTAAATADGVSSTILPKPPVKMFDTQDALVLAADIAYYGKRIFWTLIVCGVVTNVFVLMFLAKIRRTHPHLQPVTVLMGICLADTVGLLCGLIFQELKTNGILGIPFSLPAWMATYICQAMIYIVHVVTAFSGFAFLLMAIVRYIAIFHANYFRRNQYLQNIWYLIVSLFGVFCIEKIWVPLSSGEVDMGAGGAKEPGSCLLTLDSMFSKTMLKVINTVDVIFVFVLGVIGTIVFDVVVYQSQRKSNTMVGGCSKKIKKKQIKQDCNGTTNTCGPTSGFASSGERLTQNDVTNNAANNALDVERALMPSSSNTTCSAFTKRQQARRNQACRLLWRYLLLSALELVLGSAHYFMRLVFTYEYPDPVSLSPWQFLLYISMSELAFQLYYVQFTCNWLYLWVLWPVLQHEHSDVSKDTTTKPLSAMTSRVGSPASKPPSNTNLTECMNGGSLNLPTLSSPLIGVGASRNNCDHPVDPV